MMNFEKWRHYARARLFQLLRKDAQALAEYRAALNVAPDFVRATIHIAFIHTHRGERDAAIAAFLEALRTKPNDAAVHFNLGFLHDKNGSPREAIPYFQQAVQLDAKLDRAWYGLGLCHAKLGDHVAAARALHEAATLQPMNPHAWYALGMAHHHAHEPDKVKEVVLHLHRFDPRMTRQLIQEAERSDLAYLVADLAV